MNKKLQAHIKISNFVKHKVNPMIYGHFIEEMAQCIYDGVWATTKPFKDNPMVENVHAPGHLYYVRQDVFEAMQQLLHERIGKTVLRWPGGCFSDTYHWKTGIGPIENRPILKNEHWNQPLYKIFGLLRGGKWGPDYNNQFGTDEFLTLCERMGVEPYININMGSGTPKEAAEWVEYVNGPGDSEWGKKRAEIHEDPYNVKYWGIGNEMWATWERGHEKNETGTQYGKNYREFAKEMRKVDPSIKLIASGLETKKRSKFLTKDMDWNQNLLKECKDYVDYLALHIYLPGTALTHVFRKSEKFTENENTYYSVMASPKKIAEIILEVWKDILDVCGKDTSIRIIFDEWNIYYYAHQGIRANYRLMDGIWVASVLNVFNKLSEICPMANLAQLINVLGLIQTHPSKIVLTPSYHTFDLYWNNVYLNYLEHENESSLFSTQSLGIVPPYQSHYIEITPTISDDKKKMNILVLNKHFNQSISTIFDLSDVISSNFEIMDMKILNNSDPFAKNTEKNPDVVNIDQKNRAVVEINPTGFTYECPAHSITSFNLDL